MFTRRETERRGGVCCSRVSLSFIKFGLSAPSFHTACLGQWTFLLMGWDVLPPWCLCVRGKKKEWKVRNLHWHGGGEGEASALPLHLLLSDASVHFSLGFASHPFLAWAALAILRQNRVDSGARARLHQIVPTIVLGWLARGRFPGEAVVTWQKTRLISRNERPFLSPYKWKAETWTLWQSSWKEPKYTKSEVFFFLIHQFGHKKTLLKHIKKNANQHWAQ